MTLQITSNLVGTEDAATREARLSVLTNGYFGAGAYAGAANLGGVRALLNPMLAAPISNGEAFGSWLTKFNILNNPVSRVVAAIFTGANDVLFDFTDPAGNFADTGGSVPITHNTALARSNSLVNAVNHQQATSGLRGLWMADSTGGWYRPDQTDDLFAFNLPSAVTGTLILVGRNGTYFETRDAALGATVQVGFAGNLIKNGTRGGWNVLAMVGDVLAIGFKEGSLTTDQQLHIARAFRPFGGGGIWEAGAELHADVAFATNTDWNYGNGWSYDAGNQRADRPLGGTQGAVRGTPGTLITNGWYRAVADLNITSNGNTRFQMMTGITAGNLGPTIAQTGANNYCVFLQAAAGNNAVGINGNSGANLTADNFSLKPMTKGW